MSDTDKAAVDALADILCGDPEVATTYQDDARAILDAIRAGKVPLPEDAPQIKALMQTCAEWERANRTIRSEANAALALMRKKLAGWSDNGEWIRAERHHEAQAKARLYDDAVATIDTVGIDKVSQDGHQFTLAHRIGVLNDESEREKGMAYAAAEKAERERDEARAQLGNLREDIERKDAALTRARANGRDKTHRALSERNGQLMALLREARGWATKLGLDRGPRCECADCGILRKIDALLAGQPAPRVPVRVKLPSGFTLDGDTLEQAEGGPLMMRKEVIAELLAQGVEVGG